MTHMIRGHICDLHPDIHDGKPVYRKVARNPANNDLLDAEADALRRLTAGTDVDLMDLPDLDVIERVKFKPYVPNLIDTTMEAGCRVNVIKRLDGFVSLRDVADAFPAGIDPKDMAWMFRRLLVAVGFAHRQGVLHGGIVPDNVMIHPIGHGLVLIDWCYSPDPLDGRITAMVNQYIDWYPVEVRYKAPPNNSTDIFMAARLFQNITAPMPAPLRAFFQGCTLPNIERRMVDAWRVKNDFDALIERVWGKRTYRPFTMPPPVAV